MQLRVTACNKVKQRAGLSAYHLRLEPQMTKIPKGIDTLAAAPYCDKKEHRKAFRRARRIRPRDKTVGWVGSHGGLHYFVYNLIDVFTVPVSKGWTETKGMKALRRG